MGLSRLKELVSQAEKEGVSLGVMISRRMSPEEIESAQMELAAEICANEASIAHFMADVKVPSIEEIMSQRGGSPSDIDCDASDEALA